MTTGKGKKLPEGYMAMTAGVFASGARRRILWRLTLENRFETGTVVLRAISATL